jgi:hypothetical protein
MSLSRVFVLFAGLACFGARASAQPVTHPLWATTPDAEWDAPARAQFEVALQRRGLGPLEVVSIARTEDTRPARLLAEGIEAIRAGAYARASAVLTEAVAQAHASGGEGLGPGQLPSLFFHQAMAFQLASGVPYSEPLTAITPTSARDAYLEAAIVGSGQTFEDASPYPIVEMSWRLALTMARQRPQGALTVRAHERAKISIDGRPFLPSPATVSSLPYGDHFVCVEEPGHAPWFAAVGVGQPTMTLDVPATALLVFDTATAASQALSKGASYALLGQLHLGDKIEIDLRLLDARTKELRDATAVAVAPKLESPDLIAAVLRLDEAASGALVTQRAGESGQAGAPFPMTAPPARQGTEAAPSGSWLSQRWPLVTAVGLAVGTAIVLGILVANDKTATH